VSNVAELIEDPGIKSLRNLVGLLDRQYRVPLYQRDYAWEDDQIDDFASDLVGSASNDGEHFYGTIVVSKDAPGPEYSGLDDVRYVIDGQQRLTTALLALTVVRHHSIEVGDGEHAGMLRGHTALEGLSENARPRLFANRGNQAFLTAALVKSKDSADLQRLFRELTDEQRVSSDRMRNAYSRLRRHMAQHVLLTLGIDAHPDDHSLVQPLTSESLTENGGQILRRLARTLMDRALFIEITVRRWEDAFSVFEGLNNRGLDLSERDLVKNSVLSRGHRDEVSPDEMLRMEERWDELTGRVAESKFARFLRHYLLLHYADVPLKRIVRTLNDHYRDVTAEKMITDLDRAARGYEKIERPSVVKDDQLQETLRRFAALDANRSYPILLAGMLVNLSPSDLVRLTRAVEVLYFRRSAVMGKDNKSIEADIRTVAAALYEAGASGLDAAIAAVRALTPADEEFTEQFVRRFGMKDSVARYMLASMENFLTEGNVKQVDLAITLEHIMPKHPNRWKLSPAEEQIHHHTHARLGNLTILKGRKNSSLGDRPFAKKKVAYKDEKLEINEDVLAATEWTSVEVDARQRKMAVLACRVWSI
jgi:hypothetical protein